MARYRFGTVADYIVSLGTANAATLEPGAVVTCWNAPSGGTQYTDLTDVDGVTPLTSLTTNAQGAVPEFYGPDGVTALYLDANGGAGPRRRTMTADVGPLIDQASADLASHEAEVNPHGVRYSELPDVYAPSIDALLTADPFYIAHRGSGAQYPEHTMAAYEASLAAGAEAIEVSCQITADGVLVAFHDTTLARMTGLSGSVSDYTYAALNNLAQVQDAGLLGDGWAAQPIPTVRDVLDRFYGRCVIFLEQKTNDATVPLENLLLNRYPDAQRSIVWKAYYTNTSLPWAKANGFTVWAYVDPGTTDAEMDAVDTNVDMWGVPIAMDDTRISDVVARGKPVICWEVHRRHDVTRLTGLGVQGMMCSEYQYVTSTTAALATDDWDTSIKAPGNTGNVGYDPDYALKYDGFGGAYMDVLTPESVLLGSLCPTPSDTYTITFEMKFDTLPSPTLHADFVFGKPSDDKYRFSSTLNESGGYHMVFRGNGDFQLYRHDPGVQSGTKLGEVLVGSQPADAPPVAGQWMWFSIEVTPTQIIMTRTDTSTPVTFTATDSTYRGGYMHLNQGSINSAAAKPYWRNLTVTAN